MNLTPPEVINTPPRVVRRIQSSFTEIVTQGAEFVESVVRRTYGDSLRKVGEERLDRQDNINGTTTQIGNADTPETDRRQGGSLTSKAQTTKPEELARLTGNPLRHGWHWD